MNVFGIYTVLKIIFESVLFFYFNSKIFVPPKSYIEWNILLLNFKT